MDSENNNQKTKKLLISFIYRCVLCVCIFCAAFSLHRFSPKVWKGAEKTVTANIDTTKTAECLKKLLKELFPM